MNKGIFITFEGNDGSGKTTQIRRLSEYLKGMDQEVCIIREPGGTPIGEKIRDILLDNGNQGMADMTEMLLYAASRAQLVATVIKPELSKNRAVICDRFVDSSLAYQGFGRKMGLEPVWHVNSLAIDGCLPDITFFMDVDADTAMGRRNAAGDVADRIENERMDFHRSVYMGYKKLSEMYPERIICIPVDKGPDVVFEKIRKHVDDFLNKKIAPGDEMLHFKAGGQYGFKG